LATSEQLAGGLLLKRERAVVEARALRDCRDFWGVFSHPRAQTITTNFLTTWSPERSSSLALLLIESFGQGQRVRQVRAGLLVDVDASEGNALSGLAGLAPILQQTIRIEPSLG
jgi:hypothetical protein